MSQSLIQVAAVRFLLPFAGLLACALALAAIEPPPPCAAPDAPPSAQCEQPAAEPGPANIPLPGRLT